MGKKLLIIVASIFVLLLGIWTTFKLNNNLKNPADEIMSNELLNSINISKGYVVDECINEWKDYAEKMEEELKEANSNIEDKDTKYMLRNRDDYIVIYKLDEKGEEQLYKTTDIITKYLTEEDLKLLDKGIEITGREELNSILEDFE